MVSRKGREEQTWQAGISLDSVAGLAWRRLASLGCPSGPRLTEGLAPIRSARSTEYIYAVCR